MKIAKDIAIKLVVSATVALGLGATPSAVAAQAGGARFISGVRPEAHMDLFYHGGETFGLGARVEIPLVQKGLIQNVEDELALCPGLDILIHDFALGPLVALQWNFYFGSEWSVFPDIGFVILISHHGDVDADPVIEIGGRYHFNDRNALMLRIGFPGLLQFGVTF